MKRVLVLGFGVSNRPVVSYYEGLGTEVIIYDEHVLDSKTITHFNDIDLSGIELVIASPGFDPAGEIIQACLSAGLEVINDIELFARLAKHPIIAVTGTNGKSTVSTMIHEMLVACGKSSLLGGNIGVAAMSLLEQPDPDFYVLEVSSYQIELAPSLKPLIGVCTNITPDHLERHGDFETYAAIKRSLLTRATHAIDETQFQHYVDKVGEWTDQAHMKLNAAAALACVDQLGFDLGLALTALENFEGLPHRTQRVASDDGIVWIDDSKGTNVGATIAAVKSCYEPGQQLILLLGGVGKDQDFDLLGTAIEPYVTQCILFGRDRFLMSDSLHTPYRTVETLEEAVAHARTLANAGDCVLLSPACASFDQFRNFNERGEAFAALVSKQSAMSYKD